MAKTVELYVVLYDIEDDADPNVLRNAVEVAVTNALPYIDRAVDLADEDY